MTVTTPWTWRSLVALLGAVAIVGCDGTEDAGEPEVEDLTIVVEADKSRIQEEEQALQQTREEVRTESERLAQERERVSKELASLSKKDRKARERLEAEQNKLLKDAKRVQQKMRELEDKREKLQQELADLEKSGGRRGGKDLSALQRDVKKLETNQEKILEILGRMEQRLNNMPDNVNVTRVVNMPPPPAKPKASDAKNAKRQAMNSLNKKGLLMEDLPPPVIGIYKSAESSTKNGNYKQAVDEYRQFDMKVQSIAINRAFVQGKVARINRQIENKSLNRQQKELLAGMSNSATEGDWAGVNRKATALARSLKK